MAYLAHATGMDDEACHGAASDVAVAAGAQHHRGAGRARPGDGSDGLSRVARAGNPDGRDAFVAQVLRPGERGETGIARL
jgi:hypothetical protein